jgi:hypothetical protein
VRVGRRALGVGSLNDPGSDLSIRISNAGRAEVEIMRARLALLGSSRGAYETQGEPFCQLPGGRTVELLVEREVNPGDPRFAPVKTGQVAVLSIQLGSGRKVRRIVRIDLMDD